MEYEFDKRNGTLETLMLNRALIKRFQQEAEASLSALDPITVISEKLEHRYPMLPARSCYKCHYTFKIFRV